jgi:hypothetical protein
MSRVMRFRAKATLGLPSATAPEVIGPLPQTLRGLVSASQHQPLAFSPSAISHCPQVAISLTLMAC